MAFQRIGRAAHLPLMGYGARSNASNGFRGQPDLDQEALTGGLLTFSAYSRSEAHPVSCGDLENGLRILTVLRSLFQNVSYALSS